MPSASPDSKSPFEIIELVPYGEVTLPFILLVLLVCIVFVVKNGCKERIYDTEQQQPISLKSVSELRGEAGAAGVMMIPVLLVQEREDETLSDECGLC